MSTEPTPQSQPPPEARQVRVGSDPRLSYLIVNERVVYRPLREQPRTLHQPDAFVCEIRSDETPFEMRVTVGKEWEPISVGWVKKPKRVIIYNTEGKFTQVNPTPEERAAATARIVDVRFNDGVSDLGPEVAPLDWLRFSCDNLKEHPVYLRCRSGEARCIIIVVPE